MSTEHTPGPWSIGDECDGDSVAINGSDTTIVGEVWPMVGNALDDPVSQANAHLIAAAPDLLEACTQAEFALDADNHHLGDAERTNAIDSLRDAIAKAKGDSPKCQNDTLVKTAGKVRFWACIR